MEDIGTVHCLWGETDLWAMTFTPVLFSDCMLLLFWLSVTSWMAGCPGKFSTWAAVQEINQSPPNERNLPHPWELFGQQDRHIKWEESVGDVVFFDPDLWGPQDLIESPNNTMKSHWVVRHLLCCTCNHSQRCHRVLGSPPKYYWSPANFAEVTP